jgi:tRNA-specific 2-thiouridylase
MSRIAVLMSGGVDSSAAALVAGRAGHEVLGITARLWDGGDFEEDAYRARRVCHKLGFMHVFLDLRRYFREMVVHPFRDMYLAGLTPNPCGLCNRDVKLGALVRASSTFGCDLTATGHYARMGEVRGRPVISEPRDKDKSQTYFLALVRPRVLGRVTFPLGSITKAKAKSMLADSGLPSRERESQDLCFIAGGRYERFIRKETGGPGEGRLLDTQGNVVGKHKGHVAYTIGQRLGYRGRRRYVVEKAMAARISAADANWLLGAPPEPGDEIMVKYRYNSPPVPAVVTGVSGNCFEVNTIEACFAPAPGQILACYSGDVLLGGGVIARTGTRST